MSLSKRIRPDVEAAPWVIEEIKKMEAELAASQYASKANYDRYLEMRDGHPTLRQKIEDATAQAHRLALELECLLLSCNDNAAVSKWWDSANEALEEWRKFREVEPVAAEKHGCPEGSGMNDTITRLIQAAEQARIALRWIDRPSEGQLEATDNLTAAIEAVKQEREAEPVARVLRTRIAWIREEDPQEHEFGMMLYNRPQPQVPTGWQLVPVEPTEEMKEAAAGELYVGRIYRAMLAAAPKKE